MLSSPRSVTKAKIGHYYAEDNYYFKEKQAFEVMGEGATNLGQNDLNKEMILEFVKDRQMIAKDLTFSASKSFSIAYALGNNDEKIKIAEAWKNAVETGIKFMEDSGVLTYKYKHDGISKVGEASGCIFVPVNHDVNRECEPQLHTHLLLLNAGFDKQGQNRALDFRAICKHRNTIGRVVDHAFAQNLTSLGYELRTRTIESSKGKEETYFELKGIDDKTIEAFSTRRKQVLEAAKEIEKQLRHSVSQGEINQMAAVSSRKAKHDFDRQEAVNQWRNIAESTGYKPIAKVENSSDTKLKFEEILTEIYIKAKADISEHKSSFTRLDLLSEMQKQAAKSGHCLDLDEASKQIKSDKDLIKAGSLKKEKYAHETFVSADFLSKEKWNISAIQKGHDSHTSTSIDSSASLEKFNEILRDNKGYSLDKEQHEAARHILESKDFVCGVQGYAGTGKTTLLQAVEYVSKEHGRKLYGVSTSAKAAQVLQNETGIASQTIALFCKNNAGKINHNLHGGMLIMDESSMAGTVKMNEVLKIAETHKMQVVLVGDRNQLLPIAAGNDFARMQDAGMKTARLENIRRQYDANKPDDQQSLLKIGNTIAKDKNVVEAIKKISSLAGEQEALRPSERQVKVVELANRRERTRQAAREFVEDMQEGRKSIILTDTNTRREQFNKEVRFYLKSQGKLSDNEQNINVVNKNGKEVSKQFCVNDRVIFGKNDYKNDLRNNETGTIKEINEVNKNIILQVEKDNGKIVSVDCSNYKHIDHGYSLTVHKSQGITVEKAIVDISSKAYNTFNKEYVALSRHKTSLSLYSDDLKRVAQQGGRQETKLSAQEVLEHKNRLNDLPNHSQQQAQAKEKQQKHAKMQKRSQALKQDQKERLKESSQVPKVKPRNVKETAKVRVKTEVKTSIQGIGQMVSQARTKLASEGEAMAEARQQARIIEARQMLELKEKALQERVRSMEQTKVRKLS